MHFGRVEDLAGIDLSVLADPIRTRRFLGLERPPVATRLFQGCPIWASKNWVGTLYPAGTKPSEYLREYAQAFNAVEVNSTFYTLLDGKRISQWREQVPVGFRFCPKLYRGISEGLGKREMPDLVARYAEAVGNFADRLGVVFAQFPESFSPQMEADLLRFLKAWPQSLPLAVEFRHPAWFHGHALIDRAVNCLYHFNVATVVTDTPGRRDVLHLSFTQPRIMVRFQGHDLGMHDRQRLHDWAGKIDSWMGHGLQEIYFFTHQPNDALIPATAGHFASEWHRVLAEKDGGLEGKVH